MSTETGVWGAKRWLPTLAAELVGRGPTAGNELRVPGKLTVCGEKIDLGKIKELMVRRAV